MNLKGKWFLWGIILFLATMLLNFIIEFILTSLARESISASLGYSTKIFIGIIGGYAYTRKYKELSGKFIVLTAGTTATIILLLSLAISSLLFEDTLISPLIAIIGSVIEFILFSVFLFVGSKLAQGYIKNTKKNN